MAEEKQLIAWCPECEEDGEQPDPNCPSHHPGYALAAQKLVLSMRARIGLLVHERRAAERAAMLQSK